jgi:hypothetical protein
MPRVASFCAVVLVIAGFISAGSAQVIYEPVQYQHSAGGTPYYYGGADPRVHAYAAEPCSAAGTWGRSNGWAFHSGNISTYREVASEPLRAYSDCWGYGLRNAHEVGFTAADAMNEAYANVPRHFVKGELLNAAIRADGSWVVPAQAQPVLIYKSNGTLIERPPATLPRPLMILPKDGLERPLRAPRASDKQVAAVR